MIEGLEDRGKEKGVEIAGWKETTCRPRRARERISELWIRGLKEGHECWPGLFLAPPVACRSRECVLGSPCMGCVDAAQEL